MQIALYSSHRNKLPVEIAVGHIQRLGARMTMDRSRRYEGNPIEAAARAAMLRDVEDLSRRKLLKLGGAFASAAAMFAAGVPLVGVGAQDATPTSELPPDHRDSRESQG